jgi:hypothetical protein
MKDMVMILCGTTHRTLRLAVASLGSLRQPDHEGSHQQTRDKEAACLLIATFLIIGLALRLDAFMLPGRLVPWSIFSKRGLRF